MKTITITTLLFALLISVTLHAQVKGSGCNQPCLQVSAAAGELGISWTTSKEVNSRYFLIETSDDSVHFTNRKTVTAAGSSLFRKTYELMDFADDSATYFRITLVDMNGERFSSEVVTNPSFSRDALTVK